MYDLTTIEGRLRAAYKERWGTQEKAAKELGYHPPDLSRWLSGARELSAERLAELATAVGANGHWLLFGDGDMWAQPGEAEIRLDVIGLVRDGTIPAEALRDLARQHRLGAGESVEAGRKEMNEVLKSHPPGPTPRPTVRKKRRVGGT